MENPKCPVCNQPMQLYCDDTSKSTKTGQQYARTRYKCPQDDAWAKFEVPKQRAVQANEVVSG